MQLHAGATFVADGGGKAAAPTSPVLGANRIAEFLIRYVGRETEHYGVDPAQSTQVVARPRPLLHHYALAQGAVRYTFLRTDRRSRLCTWPRPHSVLCGPDRPHG